MHWWALSTLKRSNVCTVGVHVPFCTSHFIIMMNDFFNAERTERVLYRQLVCSSCRSRGQNWPWAQQNRHCMENLTNYWVTVSLARCNSHIWVRAVQFGRNWSTFIATLIETLVSWTAAQSGMTAFSGQDWIWSPAVWGCLNYESCWGLLSSIVTDSRSYMYILAFSLSVFHSLCCVWPWVDTQWQHFPQVETQYADRSRW